MIRILFVCLGNICRSPMAEAVLRQKVKEEGLEHAIMVDSAGTGNWHIGKRPHKGTLRKLDQFSISSAGMIGRQLTIDDEAQFDYIVGMDAENILDIQQLFGKSDQANLFRLLDLTPHQKDLPDPYFTGDFDETYDLVVEGCESLLAEIKREYQLMNARS